METVKNIYKVLVEENGTNYCVHDCYTINGWAEYRNINSAAETVKKLHKKFPGSKYTIITINKFSPERTEFYPMGTLYTITKRMVKD